MHEWTRDLIAASSFRDARVCLQFVDRGDVTAPYRNLLLLTSR